MQEVINVGTGDRAPRTMRGEWAVRPWFRERPQLAVTVSLVLFAAMCVIGLVSTDARDVAMVMLVLPVALLAVTFGRRGGAGGTVGVLAAVVAWQVRSGNGGGATWAGAIAILILGLLLGAAVDELLANEHAASAADARRLRAENAERRLHEAAAVNDTLVQSVAVAKWALEAGDTTRAVEVLDDAVARGQRIVSDLLREAESTRIDGAAAAPGRDVGQGTSGG